MIPIVGRLPFALGKLFGVPQPVPPSNLDSSVYSVCEVDSVKPERAFIAGERLFIAHGDVTAGGANNGAVTLTLGAGGAGVMAIVEYIRVQVVSVAGGVNFYLGNLASGGTPITATPRDQRAGLVAAAFPAAQFQTSTGYVNPPTTAFMGWNLAVATQETQTWINPGIIIVPALVGTNGLAIVNQSVTARVFYTVAWRERPLASGELSI